MIIWSSCRADGKSEGWFGGFGFFFLLFQVKLRNQRMVTNVSVLLSLNTQFSVVIHEAEFSESFHSVMNTTALSD